MYVNIKVYKVNDLTDEIIMSCLHMKSNFYYLSKKKKLKKKSNYAIIHSLYGCPKVVLIMAT